MLYFIVKMCAGAGSFMLPEPESLRKIAKKPEITRA